MTEIALIYDRRESRTHRISSLSSINCGFTVVSTRTIPVKDINWLGDAPFASRPEWHLAVKVRSTRPPTDAIVRPVSGTEASVELITPEEGVSPGQACVFYDPNDSRVYGGGWIHKG